MSSESNYCLDKSLSCSFYNFVSLSFKDYFNNIDYWATVKISLAISLEVFETYIISQLARSQGLDVLSRSKQGVTTLSAVVGVATLKEVVYSNFITDHITPNTFNNLVKQWNITYGTNYSHKSLEALSGIVIHVEAGTYQFGNALRGIIGGAAKLASSFYAIRQGSYIIPIYIVVALSGHYLIYCNGAHLFADAKETLATMRTIPFRLSNTDSSIEDFFKAIEHLRLNEQKQLITKIFSTMLISTHENMLIKGGMVDAHALWSADYLSQLDKNDRSKEALKLSEPSFIVKWAGEQYFRFVDLLHRVEMINQFLVTCVEDSNHSTTLELPTHSEDTTTLSGNRPDSLEEL